MRVGNFDDFFEEKILKKTRVTPAVATKIIRDIEAKIIAAALGPPPSSYARWTLRLLAEYCIENQYVVSISHTAVGELLNSNELEPHLSKYWCISKQNDSAFVASMGDILGIYQPPYRGETPVVCMDEKPLQLLGEIREWISAVPIHMDPDTQLPKPRYCEKIDSEYIRCGTASIFMFTESLGGWRHASALDRSNAVPGPGIRYCRDLALPYLLQALRENEISLHLLHPALEILKKYDSENDTELFQTLYVYVQTGCSQTDTAYMIHAYLNTLKYRLSLSCPIIRRML